MPLSRGEERALREVLIQFRQRCADMIEELLSTDPQMPTHEDTIRRAEALLEELRRG